MEVKITLELVNAILGYLGRQPFDEVAYLIGHLRSQVEPQVPANQPEAAANSASDEVVVE